MKTYAKTNITNKLGSNSNLKLRFSNVLNHSAMLKIKGGDGEANGGDEIIIIPIKK